MSIKLEHINYVYSEGTAYEKHALKDVSWKSHTVNLSGSLVTPAPVNRH